jgi:hypothetical protein
MRNSGILNYGYTNHTHPHPSPPPDGSRWDPRAVNDAEGNQGFPPRHLSFKPTPIPTFPLRGKESYARRASQNSPPHQGEG